MYNRIELFLSDFNIIYDLQFGFRKKHSTEHALLSIVDEIRKNLDKGIFSCGVFIDLEKAFDTVNHNILLSKLDHYGIRENALAWIQSYLYNRSQSVCLNGTSSRNEVISCGVPQGSILGPLFFIIYINDMHNAVKSSMIHHFADDTNLLFSSEDPKEMAKILNKDLSLLFDWLCANRLSINVSKTEFIVFRPPKRPFKERITLKLNGIKIFESKKIKYLGVIMDTRLRWNHHINELIKKLNRTVGMIYKIRSDCTRKVLLSLYHSIFHSHLSYGISVWGNSSCNNISRVSILQKKMIRAVTFSDFHQHTAPLLKELNVLRVNDLFNYKTASLMWDLDHNTLPNSLATLFTWRDDIHNRNLRDNDKKKLYTAHRFHNKYGFESFAHKGASLLNQIKDLALYESCSTKKMFLKKYKMSILNTY